MCRSRLRSCHLYGLHVYVWIPQWQVSALSIKVVTANWQILCLLMSNSGSHLPWYHKKTECPKIIQNIRNGLFVAPALVMCTKNNIGKYNFTTEDVQ